MKANVMLIASHPDDVEIGMGGTTAAMIAEGHNVTLIDLSNGEPTPYGNPEIRAKESKAASAILGLKNRITLDIPNREIFDNIENRKKLANLMRQHKPDVIFIPYWDDAHPDHIQACSLAVAARFYSKLVKSDLEHQPHYPKKIFHYFSLHIKLKISPSFIFDISDYFEKKISAVQAYRSQFENNPNNKNFLQLLEKENAYWGSKIGDKYRGAFSFKGNLAFKRTADFLDC